MGALQTYFYLALIAATMLGICLLLIGVAVAGLVRFFRAGGSRLLTVLVAAGILATLLFVLLGTAGTIYAFVTYGAA